MSEASGTTGSKDMTEDRILLVQLADIGDLVLATPAMAALREAKPDSRIDLLASRHAMDIVPPALVDTVIPFDKGKQNATRALLSPSNIAKLCRLRHVNYDTVIFFHHFTLRAGLIKFRLIANVSGARRIIGLRNEHASFLTDAVADRGFGRVHEAQYWLDLAALVGAPSKARPAHVYSENSEAIASTIDELTDGPIVVLHAGSGGYSKARRWSPARFAEVADQLKSRYQAHIVLVGQSSDDSPEAARLMNFEVLNLVGKTTLPQLAAVLRRADLFIGADSGVMHVAAAAGTPVVSIFGPSNHEAWKPWTVDGWASIQRSGVACSPCSYVGHSIGARDGCAARTCMKLVTSRQVIEAAATVLETSPQDTAAVNKATASEKINEKPHPGRIRILDVPVDRLSYPAWMQLIEDWIQADSGPHHVCTVNPEFIMIARQDPIFFAILNRAALCVADGVGLLWASRRLGSPIAERITGSDGVPLIARHAAERGWRIFFLGAGEGIAKKAADILCRRFPRLNVAGTYGGSPTESEEDDIVAMINQARADILFVAYGAPQQDKWIARNLPRLNVTMAMGIGGSLDFIAGEIPRAPEWMRRRGLEWCYRLLRQPWRLRRMLRLPRFVWAVLRQR
ncbi:MAG: WecB/TagA/CpsF family glycosyltransferase [Chloroflexi bacterium]|nr:WecB/TagA/CpsF family glycosyltransferase [Chloroflexota bacterium]